MSHLKSALTSYRNWWNSHDLSTHNRHTWEPHPPTSGWKHVDAAAWIKQALSWSVWFVTTNTDQVSLWQTRRACLLPSEAGIWECFMWSGMRTQAHPWSIINPLPVPDLPWTILAQMQISVHRQKGWNQKTQKCSCQLNTCPSVTLYFRLILNPITKRTNCYAIDQET